MRLTRDTPAGLVCLALSLAMLWLSRDLPQSALVPIGPAFYPRIVLGITAVLSALLVAIDIVKSRRSLPATDTAASAAPTPRNYRLVVLAFVVFGLYVALLSYTGYRVATFLFVAALQPLLEAPRGARGWIVVIITAAATSWLTFLVFEEYLQVLLPRGTWTGM